MNFLTIMVNDGRRICITLTSILLAIIHQVNIVLGLRPFGIDCSFQSEALPRAAPQGFAGAEYGVIPVTPSYRYAIDMLWPFSMALMVASWFPRYLVFETDSRMMRMVAPAGASGLYAMEASQGKRVKRSGNM
ncbi:hypothetical protein PENSUB_782 [Penicillium subrubescens]|uniref:Uncharacterized protein n=1 Tax=Penicillium subrubescens TaxID=1316194 RepID=A0A1Q5UMA1_9EURO|nr:hypothetical protein PENSUB_782 [Penicillium subrubescens]